MAVGQEYPLTPKRQVGTMWIGPGPGQGQPPRILNRLRDNAEARTEQYPSLVYLGGRRAALKMVGESFDAPGQLLDRICQRGIRIGRQRRDLAAANVVQLVGQ